MRSEIGRALAVLKLTPPLSIRELKKSYRNRIRNIHPDHRPDEKGAANRETVEAIEAYRLLMTYCEQLPIHFEEEAIESAEDFWSRRFGRDPLWGGSHEP